MNAKINYLLKNYYILDLVKKNLIYFIPRHLIINKNGRLINNNALKPSSLQIRETLESVLE